MLKTGSYGIKTVLEDDFFDLTIDYLSPGDSITSEHCRSHDMVQVQLGDNTLKRLLAMGYKELTLEPGSWDGQEVEIKTAGSPQLVCVSSSMRDSMAYALTRALCEGVPDLRRGGTGTGKL